ncbi:MAG TPA: DUF5666 domain-containing protein [Candidatus Baltobacteraceae bacterium]|nr:DUF5666 domain-containing protein [Candidatus Baltobacteraceae bacterium]
MRISIALRATLLAILALAPAGLRSDSGCPNCDCSHFPISDRHCVDCCFAEKGTVTSTSDNSVTITPPASRGQSSKTFQIKKTTKINGKLQEGAAATVYYHAANGENVATRIDGADFLKGALKPGNLPGPPDTCDQIFALFRAQGRPAPLGVPENAMRVFFGNSEAFSTAPHFVVWKIGGEDTLLLERTQSGMYVSAKIRGADGQLVAQIVDNEFFINSQDMFQLEKGTSTLAVYDDRHQLIFDIQFLNAYTIKVLGTFFGPGGEEIRVAEGEQTFSSHGATFVANSSCFGGGSGAIELGRGGISVR